MSIIEIKNVYKNFGTKKVLRGTTLDILRGETITIIGGSGSGKSVLLKCILKLLPPDSGEIYIDNDNIVNAKGTKLENIRKKFGVLFQGAALFDSLTVGENVGFALSRYTNLSQTQIKRRVVERLEMVGLKDVAHLKPAELSGGMQKRVGLARAIAMDPEIIFYDEPTTGLDPITSDVINNLVLHLQQVLTVTSVVVTHDMKSAYTISNRIAMLYKGKIIEVGTVPQIKKTNNVLVKQFIDGKADPKVIEVIHKGFK
jgi:phospholipid/cholesterol/gamma-HCH transport system ATP-binding protein